MTHTIKIALDNFRSQYDQIKNNRDLSDTGRINAKKRLDVQVAAYKKDAFNSLEADWYHLRRRFKDHDQAVKDEQEKAASTWDYHRLNYQKTAVEARFIAAGHDLQAIEKLYTDYAESGDRHAARVAAETGGAILLSIFGSGNLDARALGRRMKSDIEKLTMTEDLRALDQKGQRLAVEALDMIAVTRDAHQFFDGQSNPFGGAVSDFDKLLEGVKVTQDVNPESAGRLMTTKVEIE